MPQPPPQANPGLGAKLTAVALGASGGMPGIEKAIEYYQGVKDKPIADWKAANAREEASNKDVLASRTGEANIANVESEIRNRDNPPAKPVTNDFELWAQQNPTAPAGDWLKLQEGAKPKAGEEKFNDVPLSDIKAEIASDQVKYPGGDMEGAAGFKNRKAAAEAILARTSAAKRDPQAAADRAERLTIAKTEAQTKEETARDKAVHPYQSKVDSAQTAKDYLASGAFTGPSDEALMLQFFNATKPETGFRLTQTEQTMLQNARNWFGSWEAKYLHATKGTYFSEDQRKQIVDTMTQMAARAQQNIEDYDAKHKGAASPAPAKNGAAAATPAAAPAGKILKYDQQGNLIQ